MQLPYRAFADRPEGRIGRAHAKFLKAVICWKSLSLLGPEALPFGVCLGARPTGRTNAGP